MAPPLQRDATPKIEETEDPISPPSVAKEKTRASAVAGNLEMMVENQILTIKIDLSKSRGPSRSGKTLLVASTGRNDKAPGTDVKVNLNVYKKLAQSSGKVGDRKSFRKNVETAVDGDSLVISIDLRTSHGYSKSGKNLIVACTEGAKRIYGRSELLNLTAYRKPSD
jgi:hypothetical protein